MPRKKRNYFPNLHISIFFVLYLMSLAFSSNVSSDHIKILYVKEGSNGNGQSWGSAMGDLQTALMVAKKGEQIWVASGSYVPTSDGNRSISFNLVNEVSVYGGFAGFERSLDERNPNIYQTILSGEIGTASPDDNSYTVVYSEKISPATIIDGFIITGGNANSTDKDVHRNTCGGGWFNNNGCPTIKNCTFINNRARLGGCLYNYGDNSIISCRIYNCVFEDCIASLDGGAIYNNGNLNSVIASCNFKDNIANYGGGIMNAVKIPGGIGICKTNVIDSKFVNNKSFVRGSAIYTQRSASSIIQTNVENSNFEESFARQDVSVGLESSSQN